MGAIYEAVHLRLGGKRYAIKVLASQYASNPDAVARFRREALVTSGLRNEHIVEVHDFNIDGGLAYLVMELLDGEDLASRIKRTGSLPVDATARILTQVVAALDAAHRTRIVHRDLKPQNIFLCTRDGRDDYVKILDFGISKLLDSSTMLTGEHALLGTPFYMAPEQALGKTQDIDGRTDVFALGAILWELLTGRMAFAAPTLSSALYKVCQVDPPDVHMVRPDLPPAVSMVLRCALAKDPGDRTPDVVTLGREFAAALHGVAPGRVPSPALGGIRTLAEVMGQVSPDTIASSPAGPAPRIVPPTALEAGGRPRPAFGAPDHDAVPPPIAPPLLAPADWVSARPSLAPAHVASAALPAWMPSWPPQDQPAPPDPGLASRIATGSVDVPVPRSRRRAVLALALASTASAMMVIGAVLVVRARSSNDAGAGETPVVAPPPQPPAPAAQPSEVEIVFDVEPAGAEVVLRIDGAVITDRRLRHTRSGTPLVVTAEAAGYLAFRAETVPDRDQIVPVTLRPSPAVTAKGAPPRHAPAPVRRAHTEPHPQPSRATSAGAGSSPPKSDAASPSHEPPTPTVSPESRPRYVPSSVIGHAPPGPGASSSPERAASTPADGGASIGSAAGSAAQPGAQPSPQVPAPATPPPAKAPPQPPPKTGTIFDNS